MSRDDIIRMAREAGFNHPRLETETDYSRLERLVELARADEHASMMQLFTDPENQPTQYGTVTVEYMQREIAAEREACAKVVDKMLTDSPIGNHPRTEALFFAARNIRARGQA